MIAYSDILSRIEKDIQPFVGQGKVADYIPELAGIDPNQFAMSLVELDGTTHSIGASEVPFSLQSISKVFTLAMAFSNLGDKLWERVGVEPSGSPFNSLVQLEYENGKPRNPLINAGAMVVTDTLFDFYDRPVDQLLSFVNNLVREQNIGYNRAVAQSEKSEGYRNAALINFMRHYKNIHNEVSDVLDMYYAQCSLEMNCTQLAKAFLVFSNHGVVPHNHERVLTISQTKRINALMQTCGFYDESGDFSFKVGLPGKSGVGGGVVAIMPGHFSVAVWSPGLNKKGNSVAGVQALEWLTSYSGMSIF